MEDFDRLKAQKVEIENKLYLGKLAEKLNHFAVNLGLTQEEIEGCTTYSNNKLDEVIISCVMGCHGKKDLCIPLIVKACEEGKKVFVIYGAHIKEKLEELGNYEFSITYQNDCPIGLWIRKAVKYG